MQLGQDWVVINITLSEWRIGGMGPNLMMHTCKAFHSASSFESATPLVVDGVDSILAAQRSKKMACRIDQHSEPYTLLIPIFLCK